MELRNKIERLTAANAEAAEEILRCQSQANEAIQAIQNLQSTLRAVRAESAKSINDLKTCATHRIRRELVDNLSKKLAIGVNNNNFYLSSLRLPFERYRLLQC